MPGFVVYGVAMLESLNLRPGQHIVLPSGRAAVVVELRRHTVLLSYLGDTGKVEMSRKALIGAGHGAENSSYLAYSA